MKRLCLVVSLLPSVAFSQVFEQEQASIPMARDGRHLQRPWNGGYNTLGIAMIDIDGDADGDLLLTGRDEARLVFYRNDGGGHLGEFVLADADLNGLQLGTNDNRIAFDDFDDDSDQDLLVGGNDGRLRYFRNDGDTLGAAFSLVADFFDSIDVGFISAPAFGDLNDDGRRDLVVGSYREGLFYYSRTASGPPDFTFVDTLRDAGGEIIRPGFQFYVPALVDIDADGDLDLFAGSSDEGLAFYRNDGTLASPQFVLVDAAIVDPPGVEGFLTPSFVDIDGDLDFDLFIGSNNGVVSYYRNDGSPNEANFVLVDSELQLDYLDFGFYGSPTLADVDGDGDLDLFVGTESGGLHFLENIGTAGHPEFKWVTDNFGGVGGDLLSNPAWGDLDDDGDLDLLLSEGGGGVLFFENTGTPTTAALGAGNPLLEGSGELVEGRRPELADIDADGDLDLFVSVFLPGSLRAILMYENTGTPAEATFTPEPDSLRDNAGTLITDFDFYHQLADFDSDSDADLFIGNADGALVYYENVGTPENASFSSERRIFDEIQTGSNNRNIPFLADIDSDGDLDAFIGRFQGGLFFYRNQSEATNVYDDVQPVSLALELGQNYPNPFDGLTTIEFRLSTPSPAMLRVYDLLGREVKGLDLGMTPAGRHAVRLEFRDLSSGIYFYRLDAAGSSSTRRMVVHD